MAMGRVCAGIAMCINAHTSLACFPVYKFGTEEQKQKYLVPGIAGEKIGALGLTEPNAGSDLASLQTRAIEHGELRNEHLRFWRAIGGNNACTEQSEQQRLA